MIETYNNELATTELYDAKNIEDNMKSLFDRLVEAKDEKSRAWIKDEINNHSKEYKKAV